MVYESDVKKRVTAPKTNSVRRGTTYVSTQLITAPMRYARATKQHGEVIQPKNRKIFPVHAVPQNRRYRTDDPSTSFFAVQVAVTLAASLGMSGEKFIFRATRKFVSQSTSATTATSYEGRFRFGGSTALVET